MCKSNASTEAEVAEEGVVGSGDTEPNAWPVVKSERNGDRARAGKQCGGRQRAYRFSTQQIRRV